MANKFDSIGFDASAPPPPYESHYPAAVAPSPSQYPPTSQPQSSQALSREDRFREIISKHEISTFFSSKLQKLSQFKTVFIFDDSGSMNSVLEDSPLNTGLLKAKRWDELKYFSKIGIEIVNIFNPNGCTDVYFLNRPMAHGVRTADDLAAHFVQPPNGYTPLARLLTTVLNANNQAALAERKLLIVIATDGEPTDDSGRADVGGFRRSLESRPPFVFTTIVSCTDEEDTMRYLNNWDKRIPRLDIIDDYRSERTEVRKAQGKHFSFTFGDYVVKCLIGSFDRETDELDEKRRNKGSCNLS